MEKLFLVYSNDRPLVATIKGHRLVISSSNEDDLLDNLSLISSETAFKKSPLKKSQLKIKELEVESSKDVPKSLAFIAESVGAGAVVAPPGVPFNHMLNALKTDLPWVH